MKESAIFAGLVLAGMLSTGCSFSFSTSGDTAKVEDMFVDLICMTNASVDAVNATDFTNMNADELTAASTAMQTKSEQLKKDLDALPQKYGFKDDAAVQESMKNINKEDFKKNVTTKAQAKCSPKPDILSGVLGTM